MFIVILLLVVFRSVLAPLLTLAPAVLVTQLAGPVIGEASKAGLQVTSLTQIMLLILVLGAGTDHGLFLVFRVREELRAGRAPRDAVSHAALGEDYNILVMTRIREEAGRIPLRQAVTRPLERTGSMVTSAGLVLAGTFGVFGVVASGLPGGSVYRDILASLAIGILMDAFLVRTLLVPAIVALLGRWNWWPSTPGTPTEPTSDLMPHQPASLPCPQITE